MYKESEIPTTNIVHCMVKYLYCKCKKTLFLYGISYNYYYSVGVKIYCKLKKKYTIIQTNILNHLKMCLNIFRFK